MMIDIDIIEYLDELTDEQLLAEVTRRKIIGNTNYKELIYEYFRDKAIPDNLRECLCEITERVL